eukprot:3633179-Pleurochrysis_carterae.AAC.1
MLKVNIIIWDRRYIGRVGPQHRQLYICTPQGKTFLKSVAHTTEMLRQREFESIHLLYDDAAEHYEYFGKDNTEVATTKEHIPTGEREAETQEAETGRWEEEKKVERIQTTGGENPIKSPAGRRKVIHGDRNRNVKNKRRPGRTNIG